MVVGQVTGNKSAYRYEAHHLVMWCGNNDLVFNPQETKEITVDFRWVRSHTYTLHQWSCIEQVSSFKFHISDNLFWFLNFTILIQKRSNSIITFYRTLRRLSSITE